MNDSAVDAAIDKTHLRTTKRIVPHVKRQHPNVTEQQIKAVNKTRPKDSYSHDPQRYYYPVFANHRHAFQMDLLEQSRERPDTFPAYTSSSSSTSTQDTLTQSQLSARPRKPSTKSSLSSSTPTPSRQSFVMMKEPSHQSSSLTHSPVTTYQSASLLNSAIQPYQSLTDSFGHSET